MGHNAVSFHMRPNKIRMDHSHPVRTIDPASKGASGRHKVLASLVIFNAHLNGALICAGISHQEVSVPYKTIALVPRPLPRWRGWSLPACVALLNFAWLPIAGAGELCVHPSAEVTTAVAIRQAANIQSRQIGRLAPTANAIVVGEVPHWYRVSAEPRIEGFVSKAWTVLLPCSNTSIAGLTYEVYAIDVGTGLALFVRGEDFSLLYDAGSNDDLAKGDRNRVLAFLKEIDPDLEDVDHLIISHPHRDHIELLPDILENYNVRNVWHSGASNITCTFRNLLRAISSEEGVRYHTGLLNYGVSELSFDAGCRADAEQIEFPHRARITTEPVSLGQNASMQFLYVDGKTRHDVNDNSLIVRLDLGSKRILLMGDAGGGGRALTSLLPQATSVEGILAACCARELKSDVLVVGHHGSMTSSRNLLLDVVGASAFIVSSGPFKYSGTMLPDTEVIEELEARGAVWRTDLDDEACRISEQKIGPTNDGKPGGCNNVRLRISDSDLRADYYPNP